MESKLLSVRSLCDGCFLSSIGHVACVALSLSVRLSLFCFLVLNFIRNCFENTWLSKLKFGIPVDRSVHDNMVLT